MTASSRSTHLPGVFTQHPKHPIQLAIFIEARLNYATSSLNGARLSCLSLKISFILTLFLKFSCKKVCTFLISYNYEIGQPIRKKHTRLRTDRKKTESRWYRNHIRERKPRYATRAERVRPYDYGKPCRRRKSEHIQ